VGLLDSIADVAKGAKGIVHEAGDEIGSVAKAAYAIPVGTAGLVWDLAKYPVPGQDGDLSDLWKTASHIPANMADPLINTNTFTGQLAHPVMQKLDHFYSVEVAQPTSASLTQLDYAWQNHDIGALFDDHIWDRAHELTKDRYDKNGNRIYEGRSPGQAMALLFHNHQGAVRAIPVAGTWLSAGTAGGTDETFDPLDPEAYAKVHKGSPLLLSLTSGSVDAAMRWYADPGMLAGRAASLAKIQYVVRPISEADKSAGLLEKMTQGKSVYRSRTEALNGKIENGVYHGGFLDGKTELEIKAIPEIAAMPNSGKFASLLAETNKITNPAEKVNRRNFYMAVANGDVKATRAAEGARDYMDDALQNYVNDDVLGLREQVAVDDLAARYTQAGLVPPSIPTVANPAKILTAEKQVSREPGLLEHLDREHRIFTDLVGTRGEGGTPGFADTLRSAPRITAGVRRDVGRIQDKGLMRGGSEFNTGHERLNGLLNDKAKPFTRAVESFYQATPNSMPLRIIHGVAVKQAKLPVTIFDSLRNIRPDGMVNASDPDESFRQLDAYLRKSGAPLPKRMELTSKMAAADNSFARAMVLQEAERHAWDWVLAKHGLDHMDAGVKRQIIESANVKRKAMLESRDTRAYSATEDANGVRIDHIGDEDGIPSLVAPVLDTQGQTLFPMADINEIDRMVRRHNNVFSALARAVEDEKYQFIPGPKAAVISRLGDYSRATGSAYENLSSTLMPVIDGINKAWKFSVLFRLGYPMRVIADDHMRAYARMGGSFFVNSIADGTYDLVHNLKVARFDNPAEAQRLKATHFELTHKLAGGKAMAEQNRIAWDEIKKREKRLPKLKSAKKRAEYQTQIDLLKSQHPEEFAPLQEQLATITNALETGSYKATKKRLGGSGDDTMLVHGVRVQTDYAGTHGEVTRNAAADAQMMDELDSLTESTINRVHGSGGFHQIIKPEDPKHLENWAHAINFQLAPSELARKIIEGGTADELAHWLKTTARGREIRREFPMHGADPERWADNIERMVDDYLPTRELREAALKGRVTPAQLDKAVPEAMRKDVHGRVLDSNLETGRTFQAANHIRSSFYKWVGRSSEVASRHPLHVAFYNDEIKRRIAHRLAVAKADGRDYLTAGEIRQQEHLARLYAHKQLNKTLFSLGETTEAAHFLRLVSPFFSAWQEGLNRWWGIVSDKPQVLRAFQLGFDAPRKLGLVTDEHGAPVAPGDGGPSDNHYINIRMPEAWGGGWDPHLKFSEASVSLVTQGGGAFNPGAGPIVQFPLNEWAVRDPENKDVQKVVEALLPLGSRDDRMAIFESSGIRSLNTVVGAYMTGHHTAQFEQFQAMRAMDLSEDWAKAHPGQRMDQSDRAGILKEAERQAKHMAAMKFLTSELSPVSVNQTSRYQVQIDAFRSLQDREETEGHPNGWALDQFMKQYGEDYFRLTEPSSSNPAGVPQTLGAVGAIKKYGDLKDKVDPSVFRLLIGPDGEGEFNSEARNYFETHPMAVGSSDPYIQKSDPKTSQEDAQVAQGWYDYNKIVNKLNVAANQRGLASYLDADDLVARKRKAVEVLGRGNDLWNQDYHSFNDASYDQTLQSLQTIASDKKFKSDPSRPAFAIQQYLTLRQAVTDELTRRTKAGGASTIEAGANADLALAFKKGVSQLVESNSYFADYAYSGIIEHDPYLKAAEIATPAVSYSAPTSPYTVVA